MRTRQISLNKTNSKRFNISGLVGPNLLSLFLADKLQGQQTMNPLCLSLTTIYPVRITGGGVHVPLRTCSPGRYVRITILNVFDTEVAGVAAN